LAIEHSRIEAMQQNDNNQTNRTNEELEIEVNKLIEDYERLKSDNSQLANTLEMERRLRE
jgi:succinate dehydrogenase/fumarate reductase flavoprotein subunit